VDLQGQVKRVTLVGPVHPYRGGIALHTALAAKALMERGYLVQVISFRRQYPAWLYPGATDKDQSSLAIKTSAEYLLDPISPGSWYRTASRIAESRPDLVAIQWWTTFWSLPYAVLTRLLKNKGCQVAYIIHNVLPHETRPWDRSLARLALSAAYSHIVHTDVEKQRLLSLLPGCKVQVTPLPVWNVFPAPRMTQAQARHHLSLPETGPILLFFGFVRPYKGLSILLQALGILRQQGVHPYLAITGEFWHDKQSYLDQIAQLGLEQQVRIEDRYIPNEELAVWFTAADVAVAPYIEGTTQSAVASLVLGFGLPLILSEQVARGVNPANMHRVMVTPTGDAAALAQAIKEFLERTAAQPIPDQPVGDDWGEMVKILARLAESALPVV
jgi:glycosyltransferase involved in cell wall biosynthesis